MAVLEGIRKKTGLLLVFVAGALLLFLVQGFADDILKFSGSDEGQYKGEIAGDKIKNDLFERKAQQKEALARFNYQQSGQEFPEYMVNGIQSEVWNEMIYENGLKGLFEKAGIFLTDDSDSKGSPEIVDLMQGTTVSDQVKQAFTGADGVFDVENVKQQWRSIAQIQDIQQRENQQFRMNAWVADLARQRHMDKFGSLFEKSNYITLAEAKRQHYAENSTVSFDAAYIPFASVPDSMFKSTLTDSELKKHLEANKNKFEFKDGRTVEFVVFDVVPSKSDTTKAFTAAVKAADGFRKTSNDTAFYNMNSDKPVQPSLFTYDQLPTQLKEDTGFLGKGFVKGPVVEYGSYDVYKIIDKKKVELAQTAHILISFKGADSAAIQTKALEVLAKAKAGDDFGMLAAMYSEDPGSKDNKGEYPATEKGSGWVKEFEDAVFNAKNTGVLPNLVKTQFGYHIMKILKTPYKEEKFVVVKISKEIKPSSATRDMKFREVNVFANGLDNISALKTKVEADKKLEWVTSPLLTKNSKSIGSVYNADEIVSWAYSQETDLGDVRIFNIPNSGKYVIAGLKSISDKKSPQVDDARQAIERSLYNELKAIYLKEKLDATAGDLYQRVNKLNAKNGPGYAKFSAIKNHKFSTNYVQDIGNEPKMVGLAMAISAAKAGEWTKTEIGESGVFIIKTIAKSEATKPAIDYNAEKKILESKVAPNSSLSKAVSAMQEKLKVIDYNN